MPRKKKRAAFKVTMRPEGGGVGENGRQLLRVMEVYADDETAAREYAVESALAEAQAYDRPVYQVESIEKV